MPFDYKNAEVGAGVGSSAGSFLGPLIAEAIANGDYDRARQLYQQSVGQFSGTGAEVGPSAFAGIQGQLDPRTRAMQESVLQELSGVAHNGGMTPAMRQQLEAAREDASQYERGQRGALMANFRARGMGGSNLEAANLLTAQQGGANREAMQGMSAAAEAQKRAYDALLQTGQLSGQMRTQDYGQAADAARAQDAISEFNARNRIQKAEDLAKLQQGGITMDEQAADRKAKMIAGGIQGLGTLAGSLWGGYK